MDNTPKQQPVNIQITYCVEWGFLPMAAGLAAAIENKFGLQAELIHGHDGIYEIAVNRKLVYSNQACDHPPVEEEVFAEIGRYRKPMTETPQVDDAPVDTGSKTEVPFCSWSPPATT